MFKFKKFIYLLLKEQRMVVPHCLPLHWPKTFFSASLFRKVVNFWEWVEVSLHWIEAPGPRQAKWLITPLAVTVDI